MKPEQSLWNWLKSHLDKQGVFNKRIETTTGVGFPDVFVAKNGRMAFIELKAMHGNRIALRAAQGAWHTEAEKAGVPVFIINADKATKEISVWKAPVKLAELSDEEHRDHRAMYGRKILSTPLFKGTQPLAAEKLQILLQLR